MYFLIFACLFVYTVNAKQSVISCFLLLYLHCVRALKMFCVCVYVFFFVWIFCECSNWEGTKSKTVLCMSFHFILYIKYKLESYILLASVIKRLKLTALTIIHIYI